MICQLWSRILFYYIGSRKSPCFHNDFLTTNAGIVAITDFLRCLSAVLPERRGFCFFLFVPETGVCRELTMGIDRKLRVVQPLRLKASTGNEARWQKASLNQGQIELGCLFARRYGSQVPLETPAKYPSLFFLSRRPFVAAPVWYLNAGTRPPIRSLAV